MENLWASLNENELVEPLVLLKKQGVYLEEMTNGVLTTEIDTRIFEHKDWKSGKAFKIHYFIKAPLLGDYSFLLFYLVHDFIDIYPIRIGTLEEKKPTIVDNLNEFEKVLGKCLSNKRTKQIINNLYLRSKSYNKE